jgi:polysaccharide biosynthesis transport protein
MEPRPISITPYLDIIYRHRLSAWSFFAVGLGLTICLVTMVPNVYKSSALIMIEPPQVASNYINLADSTSHPAPSNVADQLGTLARKAFTQERLEQVIRQFQLYNVRPGQPAVNLVNYMRRKIELVVPEDTIHYEDARAHETPPEVLTVSFEYRTPLVAQGVTANLARLYIEESFKDRIQRADDTARFLQNQATQARARLDHKEQQIKQLEQQYTGSLPEELEPNLAELGRLEDRLNAIKEQIAIQHGMPIPGQPLVLSPEQELANLELSLIKLRARFTDEYPEVLELKARIADLQTRIRDNQALAPSDAGDPAARGQLVQQVSTISGQIEALRARVAATPEHAQELSVLKSEYDMMASEYHKLYNEVVAAGLHANVERRQEDERLRLLEPASLPKKPERPNRIVVGIAGIALSIGAALCVPFGLFFTDTSFKEPEELQSEYGIPVVAAIPLIETPNQRLITVIRAALLSSACLLAGAGGIWLYARTIF